MSSVAYRQGLQRIAKNDALVQSLLAIRPGERVCYAEMVVNREERRGVTMQLVWDLMLQGKVCLVQEAQGPPGTKRTFKYWAVGRQPPFQPVVFKGCYKDV
jgi:hypothetical protein